jgi:transposase
VKKQQIAKRLNMSRNTVKRLIKAQKEPKYNRINYPSKVDPYEELVKEWYQSPEYNYIGTRIFRELKKIGYTGSIGPVYRFLNKLDGEKQRINPKATLRIETPPGEQAQFDWSEYDVILDQAITKVYCFSIIMACSRDKRIHFSLSCDGDAIYDVIQELFHEFGGVTQELLIDNPKALVIENIEGKETKFNLDALRMAAHLGVELNACAPYRARTKGKVERPFNYIEEQFIKGNTFSSMAELNQAGKEFVKDWCRQKHGTTKRIPEEAFKEEISCLLPLPDHPFFRASMETRKVSLDSLVSIQGNKYSVPVKYVDQVVQFKIFYGYRIDLYDLQSQWIASHELSQGHSSISRMDDHYADIAVKTPKSIPEVKRVFTRTFSRGTEYLEKASKRLQQPSYHARQILKLQELYTIESLELLLGYCIDHNLYEIDTIKETLKVKAVDILFGGLGREVAATTEANPELIRDLSYYGGGGPF